MGKGRGAGDFPDGDVERSLMKILLAIDGSELSGAAVRTVAQRPWPAGAACSRDRGPSTGWIRSSTHRRRATARPPSRCRAPADFREALVGPLQRVQVIGPVEVERLVGELDDPAA